MADLKNITWCSGYRIVPRAGFFGPLLDFFWPRTEPTGFCGFLAEDTEGVVYASSDGVTWAQRAATEDEING